MATNNSIQIDTKKTNKPTNDGLLLQSSNIPISQSSKNPLLLRPTDTEKYVFSVSGEYCYTIGFWKGNTTLADHGTLISLKVPRTKKIAARFIRKEAELRSSLPQNNFIVQALGIFNWNNVECIVLNGQINSLSLHDCLCRLLCKNISEVALVAIDIIKAVYFLHEHGILVCNLSCKTNHILFCRDFFF